MFWCALGCGGCGCIKIGVGFVGGGIKFLKGGWGGGIFFFSSGGGD